MSDSEEQLKLLLLRAMEGDRTALGLIVEKTYDAATNAIVRTLVRNGRPDPADAEQAQVEFLGRFHDVRFLERVLEANDVTKYVAVCAANFAKDFSRRTPSYVHDPGSAALLEAREVPPAALIEVHEQWQPLQDFIANLPELDRWLLLIMQPDVSWPETWIEALAKHRGVTLEQVRGELGARLERSSDAMDARERRVEAIQLRVGVRDRNLAIVRSELARRGHDEGEPTSQEPLASEREQELLRSANARRNAPSAELVALLAAVDGKRERDAELLAAELVQLEKPEAPNWEDVLGLLGQLPDDPVALKREINRITQRYRRVLQRIRERFAVEGSSDGA